MGRAGSAPPVAGYASAMAPPLAELIGAIDAVAGRWYTVEVGEPTGERWVRGDQWAADGGALVARQLAELGAAMGGGPDVAAMFAAAVYARAAVIPLLGAFRVGHVALDLTPERLRVHRAAGGWFDRFALDPTTPVLAPTDPIGGRSAGGEQEGSGRDEVGAAIAVALRATLTPHLATVRALAPIGLRGLWATVGDTIGETSLAMGPGPGGSIRDTVDDVALILDQLAPEVPVHPTFPVVAGPLGNPVADDVEMRRSVCCLAYKCANGVYCVGCPLITPLAT